MLIAQQQGIGWQKVHIFVSSTFNDMHAERDYLVKRVFPELQDWCERRKLRFVDIDLRWGVTEQDATHNKNVVKVCLDRIDDCRPFFLCFLGQRRGWVPKDDEVSAETFDAFPDVRSVIGAASVTEMEILHALINPLHRSLRHDKTRPAERYEPSKHSFFYLRDPSYLHQLPSDPPMLRETYTNEGIADEAEREEQDLALTRWREETIPHSQRPYHPYKANWDPNATTPEIMLALHCRSTEPANIVTWRDQWQRAGVTGTGLNIEDDPVQANKARAFNRRLSAGRLSDFKSEGARLSRVIVRELQDAIAERYPDHSEVEHESELQKEIDQQEQFLFTASEGFIEREGDFAELDDYVESGSNKLFVLTAPGGMGKSTLLANWVERYRRRIKGDADRSIHFRFIGQSDSTTTASSLLRLLLDEIKQVANKLDEEIPLDPIKLRYEWPALLEAIGERGETVIVLDALNQLESGLVDVGWLPRQLPHNIKLIVSFKRGPSSAEELYERFSQGNHVWLSKVRPFENADDRSQLVSAYLSQYLKELDPAHVETLINLSGAENPLYLKVVLSELRVFGAYANLAAEIHSDFGDTPLSAFVRVLDRLENDPAHSPIDPKQAVPLLFGLLAQARRGLSVDELTSLFIQDLGLEDTEESREAAADTANLFLRQVRTFLTRREGRYDFFFESFRIAAQQCYVIQDLKEAAPKRSYEEWHHLLAAYFGSLPTWLEAAPSSQSQSRQPARRKVAELPHHLIQAKLSEALNETLCDLDFIEAKCTAGMLFDLLRDFDGATEEHGSPAVAQVRRALGVALPSLSRRPELTLQIMYNGLRWFDALALELRNSLEVARSRLDTRPFWISTEAPVPGAQTASNLGIPFGFVAPLQAMSLNGQAIAIASFDGEIEVRDLHSGELIGTRGLNAHDIVAIALSEDAASLAWKDATGVVYSEGSTLSFSGRKKDLPLAYHSALGILTVRQDHALVAWQPEQNQSVVLARGLAEPLLVLRVSRDAQTVLFVAGERDQMFGLARIRDDGWVTKMLPQPNEPIADADFDPKANLVLVASKWRGLRVLELETGAMSASLDYERRDDVIITGAVEKCAWGCGDSLGWAFFATRDGQLAAWNWSDNTVERLEDYRTRFEYGSIVLFGVLPPAGRLFISTELHGTSLTRQRRRQNALARHEAPVTECLMTAADQIVSLSQEDRTVRWSSAEGLKPIFEQIHKGPLTIARCIDSDDVLIGTQQGFISRQAPAAEVSTREVFKAFSEPVVSLFDAGGGYVIAAGKSASASRVHLPTGRAEVLWHGTGRQTQKKIFAAAGGGLFWSQRLDQLAGGTYTVVSLIRESEREDAIITVPGELASVALTGDGTAVCLAGEAVEIRRRIGQEWQPVCGRQIPVDLAAFLGDESLLAVMPVDSQWLEVWHVSEGLPTVAAIGIPGEISCLSAMEDRLVVGLRSGGLMSLRVHMSLANRGNSLLTEIEI